MTAYASPLPVYPLKAVVVCNSDVPWSRSTSEYWAAEHGVDAFYIDIPFGTNVVNAAASSTSSTYIRPTNQDIYNDLIAPVASAAEAHGARAIFMGPATPIRVRWFSPFASGGFTQDLLPPLMSNVRGLKMVLDEGLSPLPNLVLRSEFLWYGISGGPVNLGYRYGAVPRGDTQKYGLMTGGSLDVGRGPQILIRSMRGRFGFPAGHIAATVPAASRASILYSANITLTGRIGKPVIHSDGAVTASYMGNETEAGTIAIVDGCIANEGSIATHKDKPVYVGISYRLSGMSDSSCIAAVDMLRRAGFTDVRYFTRNIVNTVNMEIYTPVAGREFAYSSVPTEGGRDCFMQFGYALHNQRPGSTTVESDGVSGVDIDNLFVYQSGAVAYSGTSQALRHPMRATKQLAGGGWGVLDEPGMRTSPHSLVYAMLHGYSLAEAVEVTALTPFTFHCTIGDPLYAPFRNQPYPTNEWWAPEGTAVGAFAPAEQPLDLTAPLLDWPTTPPHDNNPPTLQYNKRSDRFRDYRGKGRRW
jgi:hypothetical protein